MRSQWSSPRADKNRNDQKFSVNHRKIRDHGVLDSRYLVVNHWTIGAAWYNLDKIAGSIISTGINLDEDYISEGESESFGQLDSRSNHAQAPIRDTDMTDVADEAPTEQIRVLSNAIDKAQPIDSLLSSHPSMSNPSHTDSIDNTLPESQQMTTSNQSSEEVSEQHNNHMEEQLSLDSQDSQIMGSYKSITSPTPVLDFIYETGSMPRTHAESRTPSSLQSQSSGSEFSDKSTPGTVDRSSSRHDIAAPSSKYPVACLMSRSGSRAQGCTACGFDFRHLLQLTQQALQWSSLNNLHLEQSIQAETVLHDSVKNYTMFKLRLENLNAYALSFLASREDPTGDEDEVDCSSVGDVLQLVAVPQALPIGAHCSGKEIPADSGRSILPTAILDCAATKSSGHQTKPGSSRRGRPRRWTELEKKKLKSYLIEKMDIQWIASQLGRSEGDIKSQRSILGFDLSGRARIGRQHQKI
ncbi:hypothetical protein SUNI508_14018 [Seiridium unicorne]|uniref:Myb-like domain-containing protein n=1 Tax=Seiridium unicorne TaxID=138068 RepID=A0ABR2V961_9PEZI